jgi:hypothetical protein
VDWKLLDWIAVAAPGGIVGVSELVSRYRDEPSRVLLTLPAIFYVAMNVGASLGALEIIHQNPGWFASRWAQILMAGVCAMALFRSSLFVVRAGDRDVGIGPGGLLQVFLGACDRAVDRQRAIGRSRAVDDIMADIEYAKALLALPPYCLALMQNVAREDQEKLAGALKALDQKSDVDHRVKARLLGLELINVVGVDVLKAAVEALKDQITSGAGTGPDPIQWSLPAVPIRIAKLPPDPAAKPLPPATHQRTGLYSPIR